jgi:hypothetical protein
MNFEEWTSCEVHGHNYVTDEDNPNIRRCTDCHESYEEEPENGTNLD